MRERPGGETLFMLDLGDCKAIILSFQIVIR